MPKFAVLNDRNIVDNIIIADTLKLAEEATGMTCIPFPNKDYVIFQGDTYNGTTFVPDRNVI
jgi:hypothetical protein